MTKLRIVAVTPEGTGQDTRYYVEMKKKFLFIPYWSPFKNYIYDPITGSPLFFWNLDKAKNFVKNYRAEESKVVYEQEVK